MESTLDAMSKHPAVVEAKCAVPRAYSIFFKGILFDGGVSGRKASAGVQSTKYLLKAAKNNLRRRLRDCLSSVVDCQLSSLLFFLNNNNHHNENNDNDR